MKDCCLIEAAKIGDLQQMRSLLACGANIDFVDENECTALTYAAEEGHVDCAMFILSMVYSQNILK